MFARGATFIAFLLAFAAPAAADPAPKAVDIKSFKDKLVVLKDANGGYYAVAYERDEEPHIFYGTAKVLHEQLYEGPRSRNGDGWSVAIQAPRTEYPFMAHFERLKDGGGYRVYCGNDPKKHKNIGLTQITGDEAKKILDKSQFLTTAVIRRPHMLARDDRGVYYYVDVLRDVYGGNGHRVYVGKKGAMKLLALQDIASDSAGEVYSTKTGDLRLVRYNDRDSNQTKPTAQWIRGEKRTELIYLDIYMNQQLVSRDLGIYQYSQTICGDI
jgi:hypothetical protein